jgi:Xaa-Pro aminopeptidase
MINALPQIDFGSRIAKLRSIAEMQRNCGYLTSNIDNIRYLTGAPFGVAALIRNSDVVVFMLGDVPDPLKSATPEIEYVQLTQGFSELAREVHGLRSVSFEPHSLTVDKYQVISRELGNRLQPARREFVDGLRSTKDDAEIARLWIAAEVADDAISSAAREMSAGISELDLAEVIAATARSAGVLTATGITVASGLRSSYSFGRPTNRKVAEGEPVILGCGVVFDGYCSDVARTVWIGDLKAPAAQLAEAGAKARSAALEVMMTPQATWRSAADAMARTVAKYGLTVPSAVSWGHGIGLAMTEGRGMSGHETGQLRIGEVVCVEPALYLRDLAGWRLSDMVLLTAEGPVVLTRTALQQPSGAHFATELVLSDPQNLAVSDWREAADIDMHARYLVGDYAVAGL